MSTPSSVDLAPSITLSDVSYRWPDGTSVFDELSFSVPRAVYSLIGANGAGKTTLLRLIAGHLVPASGSITTIGDVALVPQHAFSDTSLTIASALGIEPIRAAISAIEAGSVDATHFDVVGDDWDIEARAASELATLGLPTDLDRSVGTLSGGEATLLAIVSRIVHRPAVLLLDEPTNNLDTDSRDRVFELIDRFAGTVLVVSHDLELLERVDTTLELYHGDVRVFGGPYSFHREVVDAEQTTAQAAVANADDLRKQRREMVNAQITLDRRARTAAKAEREKRVPKIIAHLRRDAAEKSAGRFRNEHRDDVTAAAGRLESVRDDVRSDRGARITMPDVALGSSAQVIVDERLRMDGPERVALTGRNGSGKTSLIADLIDDGRIVVPYAYVPQQITFDGPSQTVVEFVGKRHPEVDGQDVRAHLARFLFRGSRADRRLGELSGGERLRVALADALLVDPEPKLLIMDEPTNNLDIDTVEELATALRDWSGALLLVSHDAGFREEVGIDREVTPG